MRRTSALTSLLTISGLALAVIQMVRIRTRPRGWRMMTHQMSHYLSQMLRSSQHMMGTLRKKARV